MRGRESDRGRETGKYDWGERDGVREGESVREKEVYIKTYYIIISTQKIIITR